MTSYSDIFINNDLKVIERVGILSDVRVRYRIFIGVKKGSALIFDILGQHFVFIEEEDYFA